MKADMDSKFDGWMIHAGGGILLNKQTCATVVHNTIRRMNNDRGGSDNNKVQKNLMQQKRQCSRVRYDAVEHQWDLWHHRCLQYVRSI